MKKNGSAAVLDDLKYIHQKDPEDTLGIAVKEWQQLLEEYDLSKWRSTLAGGKYENVVFAGMGGSALVALLFQTWPKVNIPFEIVRDYDIPSYVNEKTLFIASSYSGNTEETLSALEHAEKQDAKIVIITSGGKLADIAEANDYPVTILPSGYQPRHVVLSDYKALLTIMIEAGLLHASDVLPALKAAANFLCDNAATWGPEVPTSNNLAKQIAQDVIGKSAVIYGGPLMYSAAYKWKISFNENAKHIAWVNKYSEFNHNEMLGWTKQPVNKPYAVIELRSRFEHERIKKRFTVTEKLLSGMRPSPIVLETQGKNLPEQLLWAVMLGDFVTLYTALLNGINPAPVDLIEKFKKDLDR